MREEKQADYVFVIKEGDDATQQQQQHGPRVRFDFDRQQYADSYYHTYVMTQRSMSRSTSTAELPHHPMLTPTHTHQLLTYLQSPTCTLLPQAITSVLLPADMHHLATECACSGPDLLLHTRALQQSARSFLSLRDLILAIRAAMTVPPHVRRQLADYMNHAWPHPTHATMPRITSDEIHAIIEQGRAGTATLPIVQQLIESDARIFTSCDALILAIRATHSVSQEKRQALWDYMSSSAGAALLTPPISIDAAVMNRILEEGMAGAATQRLLHQMAALHRVFHSIDQLIRALRAHQRNKPSTRTQVTQQVMTVLQLLSDPSLWAGNGIITITRADLARLFAAGGSVLSTLRHLEHLITSPHPPLYTPHDLIAALSHAHITALEHARSMLDYFKRYGGMLFAAAPAPGVELTMSDMIRLYQEVSEEGRVCEGGSGE